MKLLLKVFLFILFVAFTGCFEITEEVAFNKDGSGKAKISVSAEQIAPLLGSLTKGDSIEMNRNDSTLNALSNKLGKIKGINDIKTEFEKTKFSFDISFGFNNVSALNTALSSFRERDSAQAQIINFYHFKKGAITRMETDLFADQKKQETNQQTGLDSMVMAMFTTSKYKVMIHVPENARKIKVGNKKALMGIDGKTVILEETLSDLMRQKASLALTVKYK